MKIKQKIAALTIGFALMAGGLPLVAPSPTVDAATFTTWQKFIKKKCGGMSADAAERCATNLNTKLKDKCGAPQRNDEYKKCWRKFIRNNGGTAGENSSPFETEVPIQTDGQPDSACKTKTSIIKVDCDLDGDGQTDKDANPIWGLLLMVVNILTAGIGIVAVGGIIYAAILWTTAEDKNAQIVKSKETIFNVVVGLVAFALLYSFLQFLIPGGVFNG